MYIKDFKENNLNSLEKDGNKNKKIITRREKTRNLSELIFKH